MRSIGRVVHNASSGALCYRQQTGGCPLVYKVGRQLGAVAITVAWTAGHWDLDICGYWRGCEDSAVGWNHAVTSQSPFFAHWTGDNRGNGGQEVITDVQMSPWSYTSTPWFYVRLNYFGGLEQSADAVAGVTVSRDGVDLMSIGPVRCGTDFGERANPSHPGVVLKFSDCGVLESLEAV